jgi:hypothetical protein
MVKLKSLLVRLNDTTILVLIGLGVALFHILTINYLPPVNWGAR